MNDEIDDNAYEKAVDEKAAKEDIAAGSRALKNLQKTAGHNWSNGWSIVIRGWRGLREMAFLRSRSRDAKTQAYRDAMGVLLAQAQNIDYRNIPTETRAAMTKLIDHIDEVDAWYATLNVWDRERWTNPQTIVKHCPPHLLISANHNKPRRGKAKPKKRGNPEAESLRALVIKLIRRLAKYEPDALELLDDLYAGATDPDDGLDDLAVDGLDDAESADGASS